MLHALSAAKQAILAVLLSASLLLLHAQSQAQDLLPVPALTGQLIDQTTTLTAADKTALSAQLSSMAQQRGSQVVVLIVASTGIEPIADYANRVANTWKIGRKGVGDGVLLLAAIQDRKVRIEVARNLEGAIPDVTAKRIIREAVAPAFQQGRYAQGLDAALHRIDERLAAEKLPVPSAQTDGTGANADTGFSLDDLLPIVMIGVFVGVFLRRMMGGFGSGLAAVGTGFVAWNAGLALLFAGGAGIAVLLLSAIFGAAGGIGGERGNYRGYGGGIPFPTGGMGGGGGGFGGGGGGFSSGGGGDFGGGGASGDW